MELSTVLDRIFADGEAEHIAVCVGRGDEIIEEIYQSKDGKLDAHTKFDMASVTKILATTMLSLIALDKGLLFLNDSVSRFFPCPEDKKEMTVKHLLTHTMGIGHKNLVGDGHIYETIQEFILQIPSDIPIGTNVLYSCPGFILLGRILEQVFQKPLDSLFEEFVATPLQMKDTSFLPKEGSFVNSNLETEKEGVVNDYNCQFLGGVAGNAGIFSNMQDMKRFAQVLLASCDTLFGKDVFQMAVQNYTPQMEESRGLGFLYVDERYPQTGKLFPRGAIGHCGHTGQSIFVDLTSGLYVIILSDMTISTQKKYGIEQYDIVMANREKIHDAIIEML